MTTVPTTRPQPLRIRATHGWGEIPWREVWAYRELLWFLTFRAIKARYRQTALGPLWFIIKPLVNMVLFTVIFGQLAKLPSDGVPYPIFTYTALLPWTYFSTAAGVSVGSLVANMGIISKVYFPRLIVPTSAVIAGLIDMGLSFVVLLAMMFFYGYPPNWLIITLPLFIALATVTALAVGLWSATLAVRYRDLQVAINYALQIWMYLTPVAYAASLIPERWQLVYQLNPMYWVIEGFRWALLGTGQPPTLLMLAPVALVILLFVTGTYVFRRTERTIVDLL